MLHAPKTLMLHDKDLVDGRPKGSGQCRCTRSLQMLDTSSAKPFVGDL
jgi:hypothetical protein